MTVCPESGFSPNSGRCKCKFCLDKRAEWQRDYRKRSPKLLKTQNLKKYGLTYNEWTEMIQKQGNKCASCGGEEKGHNQHGLMSLAVDHCHETGKIRGLLCHRCNRALGLLGDDANRVQALADYRRKY